MQRQESAESINESIGAEPTGAEPRCRCSGKTSGESPAIRSCSGRHRTCFLAPLPPVLPASRIEVFLPVALVGLPKWWSLCWRHRRLLGGRRGIRRLAARRYIRIWILLRWTLIRRLLHWPLFRPHRLCEPGERTPFNVYGRHHFVALALPRFFPRAYIKDASSVPEQAVFRVIRFVLRKLQPWQELLAADCMSFAFHAKRRYFTSAINNARVIGPEDC